ncbi:uncharacterized protein LOC110020385 [Phalaenopsis equestris]|uniref:uncharacterized protein LOC110020385 n=1 Tax=Phalaenopsis equestris TaxID=78828 RepID=UPI0009E49F49|nr:uncharacterized protein LOC110020385 [Phalaenopsis equestris]
MAFAPFSPSPKPPLALPFKRQNPLSPLFNFPTTSLPVAGSLTAGQRPPRSLFLTAVSPWGIRVSGENMDADLYCSGVSRSQLDKGSYFPLTAVQRFDAAAKIIENGIYLGPIGCLTFEGKFSWKKNMLAFLFECLRIKVGPCGPLEISLGKQEREPTTAKDPFFIWFYIDDEIAVAQGRGGGFAFWCRCRRVDKS